MKYFNININIFTRMYLRRLLSEYIVKCLRIVPKEDVMEITNINILEDSPNHLPKDVGGSYYSPILTGEGAKVEIYLKRTFRSMLSNDSDKNVLNRMLDKIFIILFGKMFIAKTLFHEIGHNKYNNVFPERANSVGGEEDEKYAEENALRLMHERHPILRIMYVPINATYHLLYKKRIRKGKELEDKVPVYGAEYYNNLGRIYFQKGDHQKAIEMFDMSLDINNNIMNSYYCRGISKAYLEHYEEAIIDLTKANNMGGNDLNVYYNRGISYQRVGEWNNAIIDYTRAIELGDDGHEVYFARSQCYGEIGDNEREALDLQEADKRGYVAPKV